MSRGTMLLMYSLVKTRKFLPSVGHVVAKNSNTKTQYLNVRHGHHFIFNRTYNQHLSCDENMFANIYTELQQFKGGTVELTKDEETGIATICLNHPDRRNALTGHMMTELADAVMSLEKWEEGKGLILYGKGNFFCSGGDLNFVRCIGNSEAGYRMSLFMQNILSRLNALPLISVALIQGLALGGGAEISTSCDFRVLTPDAAIHFVQVRMGIVTAWGGGTRLVHIVGPTKALKLLTSCEKVDAETAVKIGLVDHIIENREDALEECKKWLSQYLNGPHEIIRATKLIIANSRWFSFDVALEKERALSASLWGGKANIQALQNKIKHNK